jgi:hypothetical protein
MGPVDTSKSFQEGERGEKPVAGGWQFHAEGAEVNTINH